MTPPARSSWEGLIRAAKLLRVDSDEARAQVAALFGFLHADVPSPPPVPPTPLPIPGPDPVIPPGPTQSTLPALIPGNRIPISVSEIPTQESPAPEWMKETVPLPLNRQRPRTIPAKESLLTPHWTRGVLSAALATTVQINEIDIQRIVAAHAKGEPLSAIPLRSVKTLSRGVYCWVDRGPAMEPFYQDQKQLVAELEQIVGHSRVWATVVEKVPSAEEFLPGVPHLVLSDLGLIPPPGELPRMALRIWATFANRVKARFDAETIALAPQPAHLYPESVRAAIRLALWDRGTSVQTVLALRRK